MIPKQVTAPIGKLAAARGMIAEDGQLLFRT